MTLIPNRKQQGVSLIEAMLVLVIASMIIYMGLQYTVQKSEQNRIDRTALQMQQILNGGMAYYVANGSWPSSLAVMSAYVTPGIVNAWGQPYFIANSSTSGLFYVYTTITSTANKAAGLANVIAGLLPMSYTTSGTGTPPAVTACGASTSCKVVAAVNIPGQNLSNARGVNWVGLVRHGGCVPVPKCPIDENGNTMTPQVMIVPVSISGVNEGNNMNVYPVSSFTAFATGPSTPPNYRPTECAGGTNINQNCPSTGSLSYWRACASIITERGNVAVTAGVNQWGRYIVLMAMTRCATTSEPNGNGLNVYSN